MPVYVLWRIGPDQSTFYELMNKGPKSPVEKKLINLSFYFLTLNLFFGKVRTKGFRKSKVMNGFNIKIRKSTSDGTKNLRTQNIDHWNFKKMTLLVSKIKFG